MPLMRLAAATASTSAAPSVVRDVNCYCFFTYATTLLTTSTTSTTTRWFSSLGWMVKEALSSFWEELQQQ